MDKTDLARATSKDESNVKIAPQNDATRAGTRPTFLGRTHQCVSGVWGLLVTALMIVQVHQGSYYTDQPTPTEREH
jgi:hypothetical protein